MISSKITVNLEKFLKKQKLNKMLINRVIKNFEKETVNIKLSKKFKDNDRLKKDSLKFEQPISFDFKHPEFKKILFLFKNKYKVNTNHIIKFILTTNFNDKQDYNSETLDLRRVKSSLLNSIRQLTEKYNQSSQETFLTEIQFYEVKPIKKGGCYNYKSERKTFKFGDKKFTVMNLKSKDNNCGIMCFLHHLNKKGNSVKPKCLRKELDIPENTQINTDEMKKLSHHFNTNILIINEFGDIQLQYYVNNEYDNVLSLLLTNNHYYVIIDQLIREKCLLCGKQCYTLDKHECNKNMVSYYNKFKTKMLSYKDLKKSKLYGYNEMDYNDVIFFDIETKNGINNILEPYAIGWYNDTYKMEYGKNCFEKFLDDILKSDKKFICAYNGSGFDFYFLLQELQRKNVEVNNLVLNNGRLMTFEFNDIKCIDLYLFIKVSLNDACESFELDVKKGDFDHQLIKNWESVEFYKNDWMPYLENDVLSMRELFITFNKMIFNITPGCNICNYLTLSSMGYDIWNNSLPSDLQIEIPRDMDKYNFIRMATYGGRTYPMKEETKVENYEKIINGEMGYDDVLKSGDFIFNADATSLYPASMVGTDFMPVKYPVGRSRWSENPQRDFYLGKLGFYKVNVICPNKRVAVLPSKKLNHLGESIGVTWDLYDKNDCVYTNVDIQIALENNYEIQFLDKALIYDNYRNDILTKYINKFYELKKNASKDENRNEVKREIAKLMMNAIYGQMLMRPIFSETKIINNWDDFKSFYIENYIENIEMLQNGKYLLTGSKIGFNKLSKITKPNQLGAFVLSYSRKMMLHYMSAIDESLETCVFTYTDTDSLRITGQNFFKLKKLGYIPDEEKLGYLSNDCKNDALIIFEKNIGPKVYYYEVIDNLLTKRIIIDETTDKDDSYITCGICDKKLDCNKQHIFCLYSGNDTKKKTICERCNMYRKITKKAKGIPKKDGLTKEYLLKDEFYDNNTECDKTVKFHGLKKINKTISKEERSQNIQHFSIKAVDKIRTFCKTEFSHMMKHGNEWFPKGYVFSVKIKTI